MDKGWRPTRYGRVEDDGKSKTDRRLSRQTTAKYTSYTDTSGKLDREYAAKKALLDHVDRYGHVSVDVGTQGGRKFGGRKLEMLMAFERAGVLERLPSTGVTPVHSRVKRSLNKVVGYVTTHTFRRKRG